MWLSIGQITSPVVLKSCLQTLCHGEVYYTTVCLLREHWSNKPVARARLTADWLIVALEEGFTNIDISIDLNWFSFYSFSLKTLDPQKTNVLLLENNVWTDHWLVSSLICIQTPCLLGQCMNLSLITWSSCHLNACSDAVINNKCMLTCARVCVLF